MKRSMTAAEKFKKLLKADARYDAEAYNFIYEALDWTLKFVVRADDRNDHIDHNDHHVSGKQLLEGVRQYAIDQFGCMASTVLHSWGVQSTTDFGEIVFNLIDYDLMGKQDSDSKADFCDVYEFEQVFNLAPLFAYKSEGDEWQTAYVAASRRSHVRKRLDKEPQEQQP